MINPSPFFDADKLADAFRRASDDVPITSNIAPVTPTTYNFSATVQPQAEESEDNRGLGSRALFGFLDAIDTPRAAVVSTLKEGTDFFQGEGFSLGDWMDQTRSNYGFGELIEEETDIENIWLKRGLGFAGDVLLDPLTYVAPGAGLARAGRTGVARVAFKQGNNELGQRIIQRGISAANADELTRLGFGDDVGTFLNIPFSKTAKKLTGVGDSRAPTQVRLTRRGSGGTRAGEAVTGALRKQWYSSESGIRMALSGTHAQIRREMVTGTADEAAQAFKTLDRINEATAAVKPFLVTQMTRWAQVQDDLQRNGVDGVTAYNAMGGNEDAINAVTQAGANVDALLEFSELVRQDANRIAGQEFLQFRKNWQPTLLTEQMSDQLRGKASPRAGRGARNAPFEQRAGLIEGENFMGVDLLPPNAVEGIPSVREQAHRILEDIAAEGGAVTLTKIFNDNLFEAMPAYLEALGRRTRFRRIETGLLEDGIAVERYGKQFDEKGFSEATAAERAHRARGEQRVRDFKDDVTRARVQAEFDRQLFENQEDVASALARQLGRVDEQATELYDEAARLRIRSLRHVAMAEQAEATAEAARQVALDANADVRELRDMNQMLEMSLMNSVREAKDLRRQRARLIRQKAELRPARGSGNQELFDEQLRLRDEIDRVSQELVEAEEASAALGRAPREIKRDIRDANKKADQWAVIENEIIDAIEHQLGAEADQLAGGIDALGNAGLRDMSDARRKLEAVRRHRAETERTVSLLNEELSSVRSTNDVVRRGASRAELEERLAVLERDAAEGAAELEPEDLADIEELRDLLERAPQVDQLGFLTDPEGTSVWLHGTPRGLDPFSTPPSRQTQLVDTYAGVHLTTSADIAEGFSTDLADDAVRGRVLELRIKSENPKIYDLADDVDLMGDDSFAEFGSGRAAALRRMSQDMMMNALEYGVIDEQVDRLARNLARQWNSRPDLYGGDELIARGVEATSVDEVRTILNNIIRGIDDAGLEAREAVIEAFPRELRRAVGASADGSIVGTEADERLVNWFTTELSDALGDEGRTEVGEVFRSALVDEGYDSVVYRYGNGDNWAAIAIDPVSLRSNGADVGDPDWFVDVDAHLNRLRQRGGDSAAELDRQLDEIGFDLRAQDVSIPSARKAQRDNSVKLARAEAKAREANRALRGREAEQATWRRLADKDFDAATQLEVEADQLEELGETLGAEVVRARAQSARLQAQYRKSLADLTERNLDLQGARQSAKNWSSKLSKKDFELTVQKRMLDGFSELSKGSMAPDDVVEAVNAMSRVATPEGFRGLMKAFDTGTAAFKTYALLSPGFHTRNFFGGAFNNYVAGVDSALYGSTAPLYRAFFKATGRGKKGTIDDGLRAVEKAGRKTPQLVAAFSEAVRLGVIGSDDGLTRELLDMQRIASGTRNNRFISNRLTEESGQAAVRVEAKVRGVLFIDRMLKDGDSMRALDDVAKFHFDYDDLSTFERSTVRRVIPFYTWSRKNLPLQIEQMLVNPKAYNRFGHIERNIELGQEEEEIIPQYVQETLHFSLPSGGLGGLFGTSVEEGGEGRFLIMPDLPFKSLTQTVDPGSILASTNPLLRSPLEIQQGQKFFNNIPFRSTPQEVPSSWLGVGEAMYALGFAERVNGRYYTKDQYLHVLEANMPLLARARRILPGDTQGGAADGMRDRQTTTIVNFLLGAGMFTNTERARNNELYRRSVEEGEDERFRAALDRLASAN